jgi:hypothetical protein
LFFHGIDFEHFIHQFPYLYPNAQFSNKSRVQLQDRKHLLHRFGLEPVHLLESSREYPIRKCLQECFAFGNLVLGLKSIPQPYWQISRHELGVTFLDVRLAAFYFIRQREHREQLEYLLPNKRVRILLIP